MCSTKMAIFEVVNLCKRITAALGNTAMATGALSDRLHGEEPRTSICNTKRPPQPQTQANTSYKAKTNGKWAKCLFTQSVHRTPHP